MCLFLQGDALLLHYNNDPIRAGEIVVFTVEVSRFGYLVV